MNYIDSPGNVGGQFVDPNPMTGQQPVVMTSAWLNDIQNNLCEAIVGAGIALSKGDGTQLLAAIRAIVAIAATTGVAGVVKLASNAQAEAGTSTALALTPANLADVLSKFITGSLGASGYIVLPMIGGPVIIQWGTYTAASADTSYAVTLPETFPTACLAAWASVNFAGSKGGSWAAYAEPGSTSTVNLTGDYSTGGDATDIPLTYLAIGN